VSGSGPHMRNQQQGATPPIKEIQIGQGRQIHSLQDGRQTGPAARRWYEFAQAASHNKMLTLFLVRRRIEKVGSGCPARPSGPAGGRRYLVRFPPSTAVVTSPLIGTDSIFDPRRASPLGL